MKKNVLALFFLIMFLLLSYFSWQWYKKTIVCCSENILVESSTYGPLVFECQSDAIITNSGWEEEKKEILAQQKKYNRLKLTVPYFIGEEEYLAKKRGEQIVLLLFESSENEVIIETFQAGDCEEMKNDWLHGFVYEWIDDSESLISEFEDVKILYSYNSDEELASNTTRLYFDELAVFLKETNNSIVIIGHTDNIGSASFNYELGLNRARSYENKLVELGVEVGLLETDSKGEDDPIVSNDNEENRQKNRRVEIKFNK